MDKDINENSAVDTPELVTIAGKPRGHTFLPDDGEMGGTLRFFDHGDSGFSGPLVAGGLNRTPSKMQDAWSKHEFNIAMGQVCDCDSCTIKELKAELANLQNRVVLLEQFLLSINGIPIPQLIVERNP